MSLQMPTKLPLIAKTASSLYFSSRPFVCSSCRYKKARALSNWSARVGTPRSRKARGTTLQIRTASTTASVTAVNFTRDVPPRFRTLHDSLKALEVEAAVYINSSQLRLALRGLESENAVTRIAGSAGFERAQWASKAGESSARGSFSIGAAMGETTYGGRQRGKGYTSTVTSGSLDWSYDYRPAYYGYRYGELANVDDQHPLVKTLSIPSTTLHSHNLEILVKASSAADQSYGEAGASNLLVPGLETQSSTGGRLSTITYPVHKTLIYQEGLQDLDSIPKISMHDGKMFKVVLDWSWSTLQQQGQNPQSVSPVNLALGEAAIDAFRQSLQRSVEYEHLWFDAGMSSITAWILEGTESHDGGLKPAIRGLLETICNNADKAIAQEDESSVQRQKTTTVSVTTKAIIEQDISDWAENAHTELRDRLNSAFHSRSWKRIKWWKLFWRVDDVGYIASDILQKAWLVEAEKEMIWIAGRIRQSGLLGPSKIRPPAVLDPDDDQTLGGHPPAPSLSDLVEQIPNYEVVDEQELQHPWPQTILHARSALSRYTVPPLQSLSQSLLLQTISTNALTSSLSALLYVSVSTTSVYEAGAIAAVGLVWSLRRLQTKWENTRSTWETQIREDGRRVLRNVEEDAREVVRECGGGEVDELGREARGKAREAVARVERQLEEMG